MTQTAIPFLFMRGGSSRGPYFKRADLPKDRDHMARVLIAALGSGHPLNIDGIGGGSPVTTKVAILSRSDSAWADIDYLFAQVSVLDQRVDFKPTCGNILTGVGPAAIEMGLIAPSGDTTEVKIHAVNTGARVSVVVQTPNGLVNYDGPATIDGVPGSAAPVEMNFMDVAGSSTGAFLPTGNVIDQVQGIDVTCMDVAMPMVIARAADFGLSGQETPEDLDSNRGFFDRMEAIRLEAAVKMGMGDCRQSVTPKFGLVAPHDETGHITVRYFMPWSTHPTIAVTGSQCLASCALTAGTVAYPMMTAQSAIPSKITLHHPKGSMDVVIDYVVQDGLFTHRSAGLIRTARKLASGHVYVPRCVWSGA